MPKADTTTLTASDAQDAETQRRIAAQKELYRTFIETFSGGKEHGKEKLEAKLRSYWQKNGFVALPTLVNELLEWVKEEIPPIRPEVVATFTEEFNQSFTHEKVTDYIPNYHEPLIEALARHYNGMKQPPERPVYLSGVDLSNAGGLNDAMREAVKYLYDKGHKGDIEARRTIARYEQNYVHIHAPTGTMLSKEEEEEKINLIGAGRADDVIRHICNVIKECLGKEETGIGEVSCVRKGGDELRFYICLHDKCVGHDGQTDDQAAIEKINTAFKAAQEKLEKYFKEVGLDAIPRRKADNGAVGMGIRYATLRLNSSPALQHTEAKIIDGGLIDQKKKPDVKIVHSRPKLGRIVFSRHVHVPDPVHDFTSYTHKDNVRLSPRDARLEALLNEPVAASDPHTPLNPAEEAALRGIHALTAAVDPVTGLPLVARMGHYALPLFFAQQKQEGKEESARVVLMDFTNVAGANELGHWVGDAAIRQNLEAARKTVAKYNGGQHKDVYLCGEPGGKVYMLLPASECEGHSGFKLEKFQMALQKTLDSMGKLALTKHEKLSVMENISHPDGMALYKDEDINTSFPHGEVYMKNVINPNNPSQKGVRVYAAITDPLVPEDIIKLSSHIRKLKAQTKTNQTKADAIAMVR